MADEPTTVLLVEDKLRRQLDQTARTGSNIRNGSENREPDVVIGASLMSKLRIYAAVKERKLYITGAQ